MNNKVIVSKRNTSNLNEIVVELYKFASRQFMKATFNWVVLNDWIEAHIGIALWPTRYLLNLARLTVTYLCCQWYWQHSSKVPRALLSINIGDEGNWELNRQENIRCNMGEFRYRCYWNWTRELYKECKHYKTDHVEWMLCRNAKIRK